MKEEELHTLMNNKVTEGKEHKIAYSEIQELIASQKLFNEQKREIKSLNTIIRNQDKDIEKLKKNLAKKQKTSFLKGLGQNKVKRIKEKETSTSRTANVHQLKRILCLLDSEKEPMGKVKIYKACGMSRQQCDSGIVFLVNNKLIKKQGVGYTI